MSTISSITTDDCVRCRDAAGRYRELEERIKALNEENEKLKSENDLIKQELTRRQIPIPVRQDLIISNRPISEIETLVIPRTILSAVVYFGDWLVLTNLREKNLKKVSYLDHKIIESCNPQLCFGEPYAICLNNNNEIFVGDDGRRRIIVLSSEFQKIREFGDQDTVMSPTKMSIDNDENLLYLTRYRYNVVSVFNTITGEPVKSIPLFGAYNIFVNKNYIFIIGHHNPNIKKSKYYQYGPSRGSNCIYVLEKKYYKKIHIIQYPYWSKLKGLYIDDQSNIYTMAKSIDKTTKEESQIRYLFKIDENHNITRYENSVTELTDMIIIDDKLITCHNSNIEFQKIRLIDDGNCS